MKGNVWLWKQEKEGKKGFQNAGDAQLPTLSRSQHISMWLFWKRTEEPTARDSPHPD